MSKTLRTAAIAILLSVTSASYAQQGTQPYGAHGGQANAAPSAGMPPQLVALKSQYENAVKMALQPVQDRYASALQALMKTLTQNGDLDGALAVQQEMKNPGAQPVAAQQPGAGMPSRLDTLKSQYQSDVQSAVKPIQDRYLLALRGLVKTLTQSGDLDGAVAVQQELKSVGAQQAQAATESKTADFAGTVWETPHAKGATNVSRITFRPDGTWSEEYQSNPLRGHWKATSDSKIVEVAISNGDIIHYKMSDDGATCARQEGFLTYERKK